MLYLEMPEVEDMRFSTRGEYGLRAMVVLAANFQEGPYPLREIAEQEHISEQYLEQLFRDLRKQDLVTSFRGAKGGYVLSRKPSEISVGQVLTALEGPLAPMQCVAEGQDQEEVCKHKSGCPTRVVWKKLQNAMNAVLDGTSLADLLLTAAEE